MPLEYFASGTVCPWTILPLELWVQFFDAYLCGRQKIMKQPTSSENCVAYNKSKGSAAMRSNKNQPRI